MSTCTPRANRISQAPNGTAPPRVRDRSASPSASASMVSAHAPNASWIQGACPNGVPAAAIAYAAAVAGCETAYARLAAAVSGQWNTYRVTAAAAAAIQIAAPRLTGARASISAPSGQNRNPVTGENDETKAQAAAQTIDTRAPPPRSSSASAASPAAMQRYAITPSPTSSASCCRGVKSSSVMGMKG